MIVFVGDRWLERLSSLFIEFFSEERILYIDGSDAAAASELKLDLDCIIVGTSGAELLSWYAGAVEVPRMVVDGLSSLEVFGQKLAGGEYLPEAMTARDRYRATDIISRGGFDFGCGARLQHSLSAMSESGKVGREVARYIESNYRDRNLFHGIDRPNPIMTVAVAQIVANHIGLRGETINRKEPWRTDHVGYKEATRVLLPADAEVLNIRTLMDSRWYNSLARLLEVSFDKNDQRRPPLSSDGLGAIAKRVWLKEMVANRVVSPVVALFHLQKQNDQPAVVAELKRLIGQWDFIAEADRSVVRSAILRWYPAAGLAEEGINCVLDSGGPLSPLVSKKLISVAANFLSPGSIDALLLRINSREDFNNEQVQKLMKLRELLSGTTEIDSIQGL